MHPTDIVRETIGTLKDALSQEALLAGAIIIIFLLHLRSTVSVTGDAAVELRISAFVLMYLLGVDSNIMSLAGLAIAIGDVGDMGIIMTENIYRHVAAGNGSKSLFKKLYRWRIGSRRRHCHRRFKHAGLVYPGFLSHRSGRAKFFARSPTPRHSRSPPA